MSSGATNRLRTCAAIALTLAMMLSGGCGIASPVRPASTQVPPIEVLGLEGVTAVSAGSGFTVALKSDGTVWTWGTNDAGQLGDGTTTNRSVPVQVAQLRSVVAIASGSKHTLALKSDGTVWAWGSPNFGGIGDATTRGHVTPIQVQALAGSSLLSGIVRVAAGRGTSLALKSDGTLWAWGDNSTASFGDGTRTSRLTAIQLPPPPSSVVAIAVGPSHSLAVAADGSVWAAGANLRGELCDGSFDNRLTRVPVAGLAEVIGVAAAKDHSLLLRRDGSVWACGRGDEGQLGNGAHTNSPTPVRVSDLTNCVAVGAGLPNLALDADGAVFAWGSTRLVGGLTPARVNGLPRIVAIVAAEDHGILLTSDGHVWTLGG